MPSPAEHPAHDQGPGGWLILAFAIACGLTVANLYYAQPLVGTIAESFGLDVSSAGVMMTMVMLGYVLGLLFLAPLGDLVENKKLILITLGALIVSLLIAAASPNAMAFVASSLLVGLTAVGTQMIVPVVAHLAPERRRGQIVGTVMSGLLFGILLARPVATMVAGSFGWRAVFLMSAVLMCGVLVLMMIALPRRKPEHSLNYLRLIHSLGNLAMTTRVLQRRGAYQFLLFGTFSMFWTAMPLVLEQPPFSLGYIAMSAFLLSGASGAFVAPFAGRMADHGRGNVVTALAMTLVWVSFALTWIGGHSSGVLAITIFVIAGILIDAGTQANFVTGQRAIYALPAHARSRLNALYLSAAFLGGTIGAAVSGFAVAQGGTTAIALIGMGAALLALILLGLETAVSRREKAT
jgi:predicted MFS family arabinose efflux permease